MSEEKTAVSDLPKADSPKAEDVTKPVDEATVVYDEVAEEKANEELVADVAKLLEQPEEKSETPGEEKPPEEPPKGEGAKETDFSQELKTRAKGAGLTEDLAQRLHQSGELEETLAAFDRSMIEYVQSKEDSEKETPKDEGKKEPPPENQESPAGDASGLDQDLWDEEAYRDLAKLDAQHRQRIDALEAQVQELMEGQQGGFDEWFDGVLTDLGCDTSDDEKCQSVFKAYGAMCDAFGAHVNARDKAMVKRAYAAMYPQDVFKQKQQQTVDRLRDAQGKFLSSSNSKGGPPPKGATEEEIQNELVSNVTSYLKEQGVQMSGV